MKKIWKYLFGDWSKWRDVSCVESLGNIIVIQTRINNTNGKRQVRKQKIFVNSGNGARSIMENIFK